MDELSNCLLQGYGVLPGPPASFRVTNINPTFAILRWEMPKSLGKSVISYNVRYRSTTLEEGETNSYKTINTKTIPFILQDLKVSEEYEVYVAAVNDHGIGEPSIRIIFSTTSDKIEESTSSGAYNVTACCNTVGISSQCMSLCNYSAKLSDLKSLTDNCTRDFPKVI